MIDIRFDPNHLALMKQLTSNMRLKHPEFSLYLENVDSLLRDWEQLIVALDVLTEEA